MNTKGLNKIGFTVILILVISFLLILSACDTGEKQETYVSVKVTGPTEILVGEFDLSDYKLILETADGDSKEVTITSDMVSAENISQFKQPGTYDLIVLFEGQNTTLSITVKKAVYDISSIKFESKTFEYDGKAKSLTIEGNLPSGIRVEYIGNGQTEIGIYTVTAKFIVESCNYEPIEDMVATLSIVAPVYEISFDLNGGTSAKEFITLSVTSVTKDDFAFDLVKSGWSFRGWSLNGVMIFDSKGYQLNEIEYSKQMEFVAEFNQKAVLTIEQKFLFNGEFIEIAEETGVLTGEGTYDYNTYVNLSVRPYEGYSFVGWYYDGLALSNQQDYRYMMWDKDITLQAVYEYSKYDLNVYSNDQSLGKIMLRESGDSSFSDSVTYRAYYTQQITVAAYTETDIRFLGWYNEKNALVSTNAVYTFVMPNKDYKLQAIWNKFSVTYELGGGQNNVANPSTYTIEDNIVLQEATRDAYDFVEWQVDGVAKDTIERGSYGDITFTAVWKAIDYVITYNLNGGQNSNENPATYTIEDGTIILQDPTKLGYTFKGWYSDALFTNQVTQISEGSKGEVSLWAKWEIIDYNINYELNGGQNAPVNPSTYTVEDETITLQVPTKDAYDFVEWQVDGVAKDVIEHGSYGDITFAAVWKAIDYAITYNLNGGQNSNENPATYTIEDETIMLQDPTKLGYTFKGWYSDALFTNQVTQISEGSKGEVSLWAKWEIIDYNINYELNGGQNALVNPSTYTVEDETITLQVPTKDAYDFVEWQVDGVAKDVIEHGSYGDITFTAIWEATEYTITYNLNGGQNSIENPTTFTIKDLPLTFNNATKNDCLFENWYSDSEFENKISQITHVGDIELFAKFIQSTEGLQYQSYGTYYGVSGYQGSSDNVIIPDTYKDLSVTSISSDAFKNCNSLISVTIPDSVTSIDSSAFYGCSGLTSINIPDGVTSIGSDAFRGCSSLISITIPDSVTSIGSSAFYGCSGLTSINIPDGVTSIGSDAFRGCSSLISITIPDSVTSIGSSAFSDCSGLTSINIPDGVTSIGYYAFYSCNSLEKVDITDIRAWCNIEFMDSFSNPLYYAQNLYLDGELVTEIVIPDGVTSIGDYAFYGCSSLESVIFGENSQLESVGYSAFAGCTSLTSITIPEGVTSIGDYAFSDCSGLTSINIPDGVTNIGQYAFSGCSSLEKVYISDIKAWCNISFLSTLSNPLVYAKNLYLNGELVTDIVIPDGVTSIGYSAFAGCTSLTSITIPDSVTSIGYYAFYGCSSLTSINLPEGVTSIGDYAFYSCSSLTSINIPDGVTSIGESAFFACSSLTNITIPEGVTSIGDYVFQNCSSLISITIPDSVTSIGGEAFDGCSSLESVIFGENSQLESVGYSAFDGCTSLTSITIPDSVTSIGTYAFYGCSSLTSITIPDSVTSIGYYAFDRCSNLTNVTFNNTQGWWYSESSLATSGTSISSSDLEDPATAANYLTNNYSSYYWKRS